MFPAMRSSFLAVILLCFCIQLAVAERYAIHRRDEPKTSSDLVTETSTSAARSTDGSESTAAQSSSASTSTTSVSSSASSTIISVSQTATEASAAATSTVDSSVIYNSTIPAGQLPIQPRITPGFGVAGIILIITGVGYALVGIKSRLVHISLSAAYLAGISVTVLIIYVMNPPISDAVQGAYVVAVVLTGLFVGGGACIFTELTEGLGALLGGFCFSMWLLCLKPGGLVTTESGRIAFIAAFSASAFATTFTHYTRPYGLIGGISFAGATAVVMGIDCFSRAGLKEFWAYVWDLNDNLFPLGATTYPVTRGIRVETAAIFVLFLVGIVSQSKLWKIIKERREKRALEKQEDDRALRQEEEDIGRRIEQETAVDRDQWESTYGNQNVTSDELSRKDSGVGSMDKKGASSTVTSVRNFGEVELEMESMPPLPKVENGIVVAEQGQDGGAITVRVARDPEPQPELDEAGKPIVPDLPELAADNVAVMEETSTEKQVKDVPKSEVPTVVPLPFKVPEGIAEGQRSNRSSVATFADDEATGQNRLSKHLSAGSAMLKRLSQASKRSSKRFSQSVSAEDLIIPHVEDDRRSSVAATMDGLSDDEDMHSRRSTLMSPIEGDFDNSSPEPSTEVETAQEETLVEESTEKAAVAEKIAEEVQSEEKKTEALGVPTRSHSTATSAVTVATDILDPEPPKPKMPVIQRSLTSSTDPKPESKTFRIEIPQNGTKDETPKEDVASVVSAVSKPATLTKESLPPQLSKVVMSYRTNEWAKHLSNADAPALDELKLAEYPSEQAQAKTSEVAAPVNVEELQQTPENAQPAPAPRIVTQVANAPMIRSSTLAPDGSLARNSSQKSLQTKHALYRTSSTPMIDHTIVESPIEEYFPATIPNNPSPPTSIPFNSPHTLMGQRDTMIRNRSSYNLASAQHSENSSDSSSVYTSRAAIVIEEDDTMTLSARRSLIRQSSLQEPAHAPAMHRSSTGFDSHQPQRQSTLKHPRERELQMASWRASIQQDLVGGGPVKLTEGERQRNQLLQDRQMESQRKMEQVRRKEKRDSRFDERMRRGGDMLEAHREALRKMQRVANKGLEE